VEGTKKDIGIASLFPSLSQTAKPCLHVFIIYPSFYFSIDLWDIFKVFEMLSSVVFFFLSLGCSEQHYFSIF
jgi:hypothetical protein